MLCKHATGLLLAATLFPPFAAVSFHCVSPEKEGGPTQIRARQAILHIIKILNLMRRLATEDISIGEDVFCIALPGLTGMEVNMRQEKQVYAPTC